MREPHRWRPGIAFLALILAAALLVGSPGARAGGYATAPLALDRDLLSNLSAPSIGPGGSSNLSFRVADPGFFQSMSDVVVTFELYALNGYPGDDVGPIDIANAPVLESGGSSGVEVNVSVGTIVPGAAYVGAVTVATASATPAGTYAVRTAVSFTENTSAYRFESRGWFSASTWANATENPNGTATINVSRLGVSGVVPETAVLVAPSGWPVAIGALVAAGLVLVGLGAWLYYRRGPGSRSGAANGERDPPTNAPSAFGNNRTRPGDSRSS